MTRVTAAAVQMSPVLYSREGTIDKIVRIIGDLGRRGVQFATFPETVVPYYPYFSFIQPAYKITAGREHLRLLDQAVTVPSAATAAIGDACRDAGIVASIGVNERDGGTLYNTQLLFDADGALIQRRRKTSPTYHERMVWGQGDGSGLRAVDSKAGRIGQLACWEHYNPLARALRPDRGWRADPFGDVPRFVRRRPLRGANRGERAKSRPGIRVLRRECDRLAE
jgi:nitrilase